MMNSRRPTDRARIDMSLFAEHAEHQSPNDTSSAAAPLDAALVHAQSEPSAAHPLRHSVSDGSNADQADEQAEPAGATDDFEAAAADIAAVHGHDMHPSQALSDVADEPPHSRSGLVAGALDVDTDQVESGSRSQSEGSSDGTAQSGHTVRGDGDAWRTQIVPPEPLQEAEASSQAASRSSSEESAPLPLPQGDAEHPPQPQPSTSRLRCPRRYQQGRRRSLAWLRQRRFEPIKDGHPMSVLQAAYSIAEIKDAGATNAVCDKVCQYSSQMLLPGSLHPTSLHMVKGILGVEDAANFEFAWCPTCGWRYPDLPKDRKPSPAETCPRCGDTKNEVRLLFAAF